MISCKCSFDSTFLSKMVDVNVYLPHRVRLADTGKDLSEVFNFKPLKTIFLLHGVRDNGEAWISQTSVMRYADDYGVALVCPTVDNSFYVNNIRGERYYDFFVNEVISFVRGIFPLSDKREDNYICGVSMGGYGTFNTIFNRPDLFCKAAVMTSVVDVSYSSRIINALGVHLDQTLGPWKELKGSQFDLRTVIDNYEGDKALIPPVLMIDSDRDYLRKTNLEFLEYYKNLGYPVEFRDYEGVHDWQFWDDHIKECMEFLLKDE
ncbi:MAG: hypothetical protein HUJ75_06270 [Parasporobacterium sp.]|nr:hypothetical protein [Parasporobacterium sp.]